jgi:uncharacterized metal-binding protein
MNNSETGFSIGVTSTKGTCPIGEKIGNQNIADGKIPVLSCEGACIRGEIARQAANMVAKEKGFGRGCHGELFTVPHSTISKWIKESDKVVMIDGCFLKCHERILKNIISEKNIIHFDALSYYKKYTDIFEIDGVPESERMEVAKNVANWAHNSLKGES